MSEYGDLYSEYEPAERLAKLERKILEGGLNVHNISALEKEIKRAKRDLRQ